MTDRPITDYPAVVWLRNDPDNAAYLCESVELDPSGWVIARADAWLAPNGDGSNERAYFEEKTRVGIPAAAVRFIEWKAQA